MNTKSEKILGILLIIYLSLMLPGAVCKKNSMQPYPDDACIQMLSGDMQSGRGGEALALPIVVQVVDSENTPLKGIRILQKISEGKGSIKNTVNITDTKECATIRWAICSSYNTMQISLDNTVCQTEPVFVYAEGENPTGLHVTRSINSFMHVGDALYEMTFYGDYSDILDRVNRLYTGEGFENPSFAGQDAFYCSMFNAIGDSNLTLFGRNFDNPAGWSCLTLLGRLNSPSGYRSIASTRMRDYGYNLNTDFEALSFDEKQRLMEAAFYVAGGIIYTETAMNILHNVAHPPTEWSAVYDMTFREISMAMDYDYGTIYRFVFE